MSEYEIVDGKVVLTGSEQYWYGWDYGNALDDLFPHQDAADFGQAIGLGQGPISETNSVVGLVLTQAGENDGPSWKWEVKLEDGTTWKLEGWCDYTGWDCQAGNDWEQLNV